jgi:hypothetical protein
VTQDLGKTDQVILVIREKSLCHCVAKKMRMDLDPDNG